METPQRLHDMLNASESATPGTRKRWNSLMNRDWSTRRKADGDSWWGVLVATLAVLAARNVPKREEDWGDIVGLLETMALSISVPGSAGVAEGAPQFAYDRMRILFHRWGLRGVFKSPVLQADMTRTQMFNISKLKDRIHEICSDRALCAYFSQIASPAATPRRSRSPTLQTPDAARRRLSFRGLRQTTPPSRRAR